LKEILDIFVWVGLAFILFIFLRGMNETQVQKHQDKLDKLEERNQQKQNIEEDK